MHKTIDNLEDAKIHAINCEIEVESWTQEELDQWENEQKAARDKAAAKDAAREKEKRKRGADAQRQEGNKRIAAIPRTPPTGGPPSSSTGYELEQRHAQGNMIMMPQYHLPPEVTLSRELCHTILENIDRGKAALEMARQTAEGAANCFRAEIERVNGVEQRIRTALGSMRFG